MSLSNTTLGRLSIFSLTLALGACGSAGDGSDVAGGRSPVEDPVAAEESGEESGESSSGEGGAPNDDPSMDPIEEPMGEAGSGPEVGAAGAAGAAPEVPEEGTAGAAGAGGEAGAAGSGSSITPGEDPDPPPAGFDPAICDDTGVCCTVEGSALECTCSGSCVSFVNDCTDDDGTVTRGTAETVCVKEIPSTSGGGPGGPGTIGSGPPDVLDVCNESETMCCKNEGGKSICECKTSTVCKAVAKRCKGEGGQYKSDDFDQTGTCTKDG